MLSCDHHLLKGLAVLVGLALALLVLWNGLDPLPPAWDEAQHLLLAQTFGSHVQQFDGSPQWWHTFNYLSQRYPPLTYWLSLPLSANTLFDRHWGQLLNLLQLGILAFATQRLGSMTWNALTGWIAAALILLYPAPMGLAHVYMTDLTLMMTVSLGFGAVLAYWQRPTYLRALGLGGSLGLILLAKWNGILFLALPLLACSLRTLWQHRIHLILQGLLIGGVAALLIWPWYGPNWLFVLSNGLNYAATTHYYVTCETGSWCWWTTYLRWLPQQMSPLLCALPLLAWIPSLQLTPHVFEPTFGFGVRRVQNSLLRFFDQLPVGRVGFYLVLTYLAGYGIYTLIGIKDIRFSTPLLPLLAVLSALGLQKVNHFVQSSPVMVGAVTTYGLAVLAFLGNPFTPGAPPLIDTLQMQLNHQDPQHNLQTWLATQTDPQHPHQTTIGVIPNTELLSSETLTYLARIQKLPLSFVPTGQSQRPDLEIELTDRFMTYPGDWGVVGPYQEGKEQILTDLNASSEWVAQPSGVVGVGGVTVFQRHQDPVQVNVLTEDPPAGVQLKSLKQLRDCQVRAETCEDNESPLLPVWDVQWTGNSQQLATTTVWVDFLDPDGHVLETQDFILGEGRLSPESQDPLEVTERLMFDSPAEWQEGSYHLNVMWHSDDEPIQTQPVAATFAAEMDPFDAGNRVSAQTPLELAAAAAEIGDLDGLSRYLSIWTTYRYAPVLVDPNLSLVRRLLEYRLQDTAARGATSEQVHLHYQLGLLAVAQVDATQAQPHFETLVQLQPENPWNPAYVSFLKLVFNHDFQGFKEQLRAVAYPFYLTESFCQPTDLSASDDWGCRLLRDWELIPADGSLQINEEVGSL